MDKKAILTNISYPAVTADIIADAIRSGILSYEDALNTGEFERNKQKAVKDLLLLYQKEDIDFQSSNTLKLFKAFLNNYPNSKYKDQVNKKISEFELEEREKQTQRFESIKKNINDYKPDE